MKPISVLVWGMDSIGIVLAVWLVARLNVWGSWQGALRAAIYVVTYAYGRMLFTTSQDCWTDSNASFRLPWNQLSDYARPALDLLSLFTLAWLFVPIVLLTAASLSTTHDAPSPPPRLTISGLFGFTTSAAVALLWIRFLTSRFAPETFYSHLSPSNAARDWLTSFMPFAIPPLLAVLIILYGLAKPWRLTILAYLVAALFDVVGTGLVAWLITNISGQQHGGILGEPDGYLYICGRSFTACTAFTIAKLLGVRPTFHNRETRIHATEQ